MQNTPTAVLRAAVRAEVLSAGLGVTAAQAEDICRRICAQELPEITTQGGVHFRSGAAIGDILDALKAQAGHLFDTPEPTAQADAVALAKRARLRGMKAGDRLEAANAAQGVTAIWVNDFRKGGAK